MLAIIHGATQVDLAGYEVPARYRDGLAAPNRTQEMDIASAATCAARANPAHERILMTRFEGIGSGEGKRFAENR